MNKGYSKQEPKKSEEPSAYRATFEGWIIPSDGLQVPEPKGPFEIEVSLQYASRQQQWKAVLLPTHAMFGGRGFKTAKECQEGIEATFRKKTAPWKEISQ